MKGQVVSVNVSAGKGTVKRPVDDAFLGMNGLHGDAHAEPGHRQVSLLARESVASFEQSSGRSFAAGDFAENLTVSGLDLAKLPVGSRLQVGTAVELEVTQIGKRCHGGECAIMREVGACIMPKEGIFCRVIREGPVKAGNVIEVLPRVLKTYVITVSDRASRGEYADLSGPALRRRLVEHARSTGCLLACESSVVPDEVDAIRAAVRKGQDLGSQVVFTTGGTGIGPRDVTPEAVRPLLSKEIVGIMEHVRVKCSQATPGAMLSRSLAGVAGGSLVFCLPGSVKAVEEYLTEILPVLDHALRMLKGVDLHT
jgi:molybdenum cofactor synthesis domain-containing protein